LILEIMMGETPVNVERKDQGAQERIEYDTPTVSVVPLDQIVFGGAFTGSDVLGQGRPA
jgi:hypothetical protein